MYSRSVFKTFVGMLIEIQIHPLLEEIQRIHELFRQLVLTHSAFSFVFIRERILLCSTLKMVREAAKTLVRQRRLSPRIVSIHAIFGCTAQIRFHFHKIETGFQLYLLQPRCAVFIFSICSFRDERG